MTTERDEDLEAFLQRRSPLQPRFAEPDRLEPPPELDRIVLSRAREAIHAPEPETVFRPARWALPFSLAAVLVLSFAVMLSFRLAQPESANTSDVEELESAQSAPQAAAQEVMTARSAESAGSAQESESSPLRGQPSEQLRLAARREPTARSLDVRVAGAQYDQAAPAEPQAAPAPEESGRAAAESDVVVAMNRRADPDVPQAQAKSGSRTTIADERSEEEANDGADSDVAALATASAQRGQVTVTGSSSSPPLRDASGWLKQIDRLRAAGRTADAQREWEAFRKAYPDHPRVRAAGEAAGNDQANQAERQSPAEQPQPLPAR